MNSPLRILHLEDDPGDARLVQSTLKSGGVSCVTECVQNREDFVAALERGGIDLVLSDFSLPAFDGLTATEIVRAKCPDIPLILVSGSLGEERAIDSFKSGATDYVLKERLSRLVPAVRRAMVEAEAHKEHKKMEAQFVQAQKMEVLGHLAGGIAHDFNNILAVILGYCDLASQKIPPNDPLLQYIETIHLAAERAAGMTRQLLVFSRKQTVQLVVLDLNHVVAEMDKMLRRLVDENIELHIALGQEIGSIRADSGHLGQLLMNLVVNARDAMPNGGKLIIATANVTLAADHRPVPGTADPFTHVRLSVTDTGTGMTEEVRARLFEAFFTTKPKGKGTGLGLATCQTIVEQSGGHISVQSELGRGTTLNVCFPLVGASPLRTPRGVNKGSLPRGTETLLLVEDEPAVRRLACMVLEGQGYQVLHAHNGQEGLKVASEHRGEPIRLVITDVIMPQMDGKVMAEWLKAAHPDIKILFTSGYTDDAIAHHGVLDDGISFLPKPYTPATLSNTVREMLDKPIPSPAAPAPQ